METLQRNAEPTGNLKLAPTSSDLLRDKNGNLPIWVRAPKQGHEYFTGLSRAKLYELASNGRIKSHSLRAPGQVKGTRLFNLESILDFIQSSFDQSQRASD
jgi:hypothetical protein